MHVNLLIGFLEFFLASLASSLMAGALLNDLAALMIFLPKSANTIFAKCIACIFLLNSEFSYQVSRFFRRKQQY